MKTTDEQYDLDDMIHAEAQLSAEGSEVAKIMLGFLLELKDRRESDLKPVSKFVQGLHPMDAVSNQFAHIESEVEEAKYEINSLLADGCCRPYSTQAYRTALELIDIQTSCESLLQLLGYREHGRRELRKKVIAKNIERGYYEE